jgi:hypothetical protein
MSADAAAPAVPDVEVPVKAEETTTAAPTESAETSTKPGKVQVAALPSQQPADIPDAVVSAEILQEAPPVRDGKTEDEVRELAANAAQLGMFYTVPISAASVSNRANFQSPSTFPTRTCPTTATSLL